MTSAETAKRICEIVLPQYEEDSGRFKLYHRNLMRLRSEILTVLLTQLEAGQPRESIGG